MNTSDTEQFYPTADSLVRLAQAKFSKHIGYGGSSVLDPSAGTGSLLKNLSSSYTKYDYWSADVCEINSDRLTHLSNAQGVNIVGHDFLEFNPSKKYSHIIMNPPFNMGAQHLLHAWNIGYNTEIVCILNAETIRNPFSKERKAIVGLIEEFGSVEFLQDQFLEADRSTAVEIALIYLKKETVISRDYLEGLDLDKYNPKFDGYSEENALALPSNVIENSVRLYNAARVALERMVESNAVLTAKYSGLYGLLGGSMLETNEEGKRRVKTISEAKTAASPEGIAATYNDELVKLKQSAWNYLLTGLDFQKSLTVKAKKEFDSQFQKVSKLEFTESNIHGFLAGVAFNRGDMLNDVMLEIFDKFTGIYVDNRQFYKSYKSNEKHRTCAWRLKHTRVVLQINLTSSYSNTLDYQAREKLHDIDKAFSILDGKRVEDINGLSKSLEGVIVYGERLDSDYFEYRAFMNGNIHLFPKRKDLIDRLNRTVGKLRQWLPDEDEQVTDEFWKNYESEKTTKDLDKARKSMRRRTYSNYYDEDIEAAIDESLAKQKIDSGKFLKQVNHAS